MVELFMINDSSIDFIETGKFLDTRLRDVGTIGRNFGQVSQFVNFGLSQLGSTWASKIKI